VVTSEGDDQELVATLKGALARYGYIPADTCNHDTRYYCEHMRRAVSLYQTFFQLPVSGRVDVGTLKMLARPRCGLPDVPEDIARAAALGDEGVDAQDPFVFNFNTDPWPTYDLTYAVYNGSPDLTGEVGLVDQAFDVWSAVSPLSFSRIGNRNTADIEVGWETGAHGDGFPFDGVGSVAAHGFYPETGWLHFDDAETWIDWNAELAAFQSNPWNWNAMIRLANGTDTLHVAIHEIGHTLGLDHSREENAIMWPFVQNGKHNLAEEDIRGVLSIYPFRVRSNDRAIKVDLWAFSGGTGSAVVDLGSEKRFLAWGGVTFVDSLSDYDRDNGVALDIFTIDGDHPQRVGWGGAHLGNQGAPSNLFAGAVVGTGREVQFRLSTFHNSDLEAYGVGCILVLD
jgi:hypothetical protein